MFWVAGAPGFSKDRSRTYWPITIMREAGVSTAPVAAAAAPPLVEPRSPSLMIFAYKKRGSRYHGMARPDKHAGVAPRLPQESLVFRVNFAWRRMALLSRRAGPFGTLGLGSVSYTHLTPPTIYSV